MAKVYGTHGDELHAGVDFPHTHSVQLQTSSHGVKQGEATRNDAGGWVGRRPAYRRRQRRRWVGAGLWGLFFGFFWFRLTLEPDDGEFELSEAF